jgi:ribosomal protein L11 methyltransferase
VVLKAYVQTGEAQSLAEQVRAWLADADEIFPGASHGRVSTRIVEQQDWDAAWKEYFKPTRISQRIVIRPSWEPYTPETGDVVVDLDPGMAFGTGTHETTRGCLKAIDALFGSNDLAVKAFDRPVEVLDVGTGSGILLIAALLLGGTTGVGIDLDPIAVLASTENCARNQLQSRVRLSDTLLQHTPGTYPLVLANILAPTLIELAGELVARMTPDGVLVLSGLLVDQQTAVADAFHPFGLQLEAAYQEGEWATLVMRRGMA